MAKGRKTGGRQKGSPNKVTGEARLAASALVDDPLYRQRLAKDMRLRRIAPAIEQMLWHYAKGKPKEGVDLTVIQDYSDLSNLTDAELKARLLELADKI
jgi:hypothetical protein